MQRIFLFLIVLAAGVAASAWMGMTDAAATHNNRAADSPLSARVPGYGGVAAPQARIADPVFDEAYQQRMVYRNTRSLVSLATPLGAPRAGEWRGKMREPEQNFGQYLRDFRKAGDGALVVQPIGTLSKDQKQAIGHMLEAMHAFFGVTVKCAPPIALGSLPPQCFRGSGGARQINAEALMERVLANQVGGGVASVIAITSLDLYPGDRWQFESAFGWSSFHGGTAVLSTRNILGEGRADRGQNLLRMVKIGVHELAHTFSLKHCAKYACLMNGCGDLRESDAKPFYLCPDCLAKLSLATGREPRQHLDDMLTLCREMGFLPEARYYFRAAQKIG